MMRILLVNETARAHTGGMNRLVVESIDGLRRAGHSVALAFWDGAASQVPPPVFRLPRTGSATNMRHAMVQVMREFKPQVVQVHGADNPYFASAVARDAPTCRFLHDQSWFCSGGDRMTRTYSPCHRPHGIACLFWHYAQGCGGRHPLGNWRRWNGVQAQQTAKPATALRLQVASQFMRQGLLENGYAADRIDVVPLFANPPQCPAAVEPGLMLAACRLVKSKGIHLLLEAVRRLPAPDWRLAIAGTGPEQARCEQLSHQLELSGRVQFLGELPPAVLEAWYARAALVVSPVLRPEPFGLVGLEAMAHGKPVVVFAGGGAEEWLVDGRTGTAVRERSPGALAAALARLLREPALGRLMGEAGRRRWEEFQPEVYVRRVTESFARCVEQFRAACG